MNMKKTNYFLVTVKAGHVGKNFFIPITHPVWARDGKEAAKIGRELPRTKHDLRDRIMSVVNVSFEEYCTALAKNDLDPYLKCSNHQEQLLYFNEIESRIRPLEKVQKYKNKKHSLRHIYNDIDEDYKLIA